MILNPKPEGGEEVGELILISTHIHNHIGR